MSNQLRYRKDEKKVLGAGGYELDHEDGGSIIYTGLYEGSKIVALLVGRDEDATQEHINATGDFIVLACSAHYMLRNLLEEATRRVREDPAGDHGLADRIDATLAELAAGSAA